MELTVTRVDGLAGTSHPLRLAVNGPPTGTCQITPEQGAAFLTSFHVSCADVVDEDTPLNYSLYVSYSSDALQTVTSPVFEPFTLELGSEADDYWVNITVTITDLLGASSIIDLAVQVFNETTSMEEPFDATSPVGPTEQVSQEASTSEEATVHASPASNTIFQESNEATVDPTAQTFASFTEVGTKILEARQLHTRMQSFARVGPPPHPWSSKCFYFEIVTIDATKKRD